MARLGAIVVGVDAAPRNIAVARTHAAAAGLAIDYRCDTAEALVAAGERFDVVLALEIVEHVADRTGFVASLGALAAPGGLVVMSTLNRTLKSFALAIAGAEYVLGWVPRGTHDWRKFVRPAELARDLRHAGLTVTDAVGLTYQPAGGSWRASSDLDINYLMMAAQPMA
jgi:2-polyprenyl-6-hydroxyphenyl methylase/3-demethylubiquinone-9 3-methyltransferase